ncbi:MAG: hypothetical protein U0Y82_14485 [Thermoleophilia bacterium]
MTREPMSSELREPLARDDRSRVMRYHITFRVFDTIHRIEDVSRMQRTVIAVMERCAASPRVSAHGMFADVRGGFVTAEFDTPEQLMELLAGLTDVARVELHPVTTTAAGLRFLRGMLATEALG